MSEEFEKLYNTYDYELEYDVLLCDFFQSKIPSLNDWFCASLFNTKPNINCIENKKQLSGFRFGSNFSVYYDLIKLTMDDLQYKISLIDKKMKEDYEVYLKNNESGDKSEYFKNIENILQ